MNEKNMQEKGKQNTVIKIINTTLCIGIIVSIVYSIYQYYINNLKSEINTMEADIEALENENSTLYKDIEDKKNVLSSLLTQIEDLNNNIEGLESDTKSLTDNLQELQKQSEEISLSKEKEEINSKIDDAVNSIVDEILQSNTQSTTEYQGPHVGTPDNGILPESTFGQGDYSQLADNVTIY